MSACCESSTIHTLLLPTPTGNSAVELLSLSLSPMLFCSSAVHPDNNNTCQPDCRRNKVLQEQADNLRRLATSNDETAEFHAQLVSHETRCLRRTLLLLGSHLITCVRNMLTSSFSLPCCVLRRRGPG